MMIRIPKIGQLLNDRYLILEKLGSGGFSEIFLARDKALPDYPCRVIKCLRPTVEDSLRAKITRRFFEREAQILNHLGRAHDQIPTFYAYYPAAGQVYLVQDYIEGDRLDHWIANTCRISIKVVIQLLLEVLAILAFVHSHRIIHRDIKPSNMIRRHCDGTLVLIDFGAACWQPQGEGLCDQDRDQFSYVMGTEGYMPAEQDYGEFHLNSDLYALGVLGIHLLTRIPAQALQRDPHSGELAWHCHLTKPYIKHQLVEILDRMVRKNYRDRYPSAQAVIADLFPLIAGSHAIHGNLSEQFIRHFSHAKAVSLYASMLTKTELSHRDQFERHSFRAAKYANQRVRLQERMARAGNLSQMELFPPESL